MNRRKETEVFETYSIPRAVATLAVPTVITQLISIVYNLADTWYVGRTNNPAMVAALSVCMPIYILMAAVANVFGIGGSSVISRALGRRQQQRARHTFAFSLWGGLLAAVLYAVLMALLSPALIPLIGGDADSAPYIRSYILWTMIIGAVPSVGNILMGHLVRSIGAAREAGIGMSMGGLLNIVLDPLFMFVLLPAGQEVTGAAVATLLSNTAALIYFLIFLARHRDNPVFTMNPRDISLGEHIGAEVLLVGIPAGLQTTLAMVSNMFANALISPYGASAVAGMGVAKKINTLCFNTLMGLTQGVLPLIGYSYGAGNDRRLRQTFSFCAVVGLAFSSSCLILFRVFRVPLVHFFIAEQESVTAGAAFLNVIAWACPLCTLAYLVNTLFQASGWKKSSFVISVLRKGVLDIPAMFVFRHYLGMVGVVWATPFAEVISLFVCLVMVRIYFRRLSARQGGERSARR